MINKSTRMKAPEKITGGLAIRLAERLHLRPEDERSFMVESSNGTVKVTIGHVLNEGERRRYRAEPGSRPIVVEGVLRWRGMEYDLSVENLAGSGEIGPRDRVTLFDRTAGRSVDGDLPIRVYETLIPLIELEVEDIFRRARERKH